MWPRQLPRIGDERAYCPGGKGVSVRIPGCSSGHIQPRSEQFRPPRARTPARYQRTFSGKYSRISSS